MKPLIFIFLILSILSCESEESVEIKSESVENPYTMYQAPSHIKDILTESESKIRSEIYREYGEYSTIFKVNKTIKKIEVNWFEEYDCHGGIVIATDTENNRFPIFNSAIHGYNGQYRIYDEEDDSVLQELTIEGGLTGKDLYLVFQYGGDEKLYAKENDSDKAEDYFDWFVIYIRDDGELEVIYEYECA